VLERAEQAALAEPTPETPMDEVEKAIGRITAGPAAVAPAGGDSSESKRARRRQRRAARPHGRPR